MSTAQTPNKPRKRSVTHMALEWLADRLRKCEELKHTVKSGGYKVDSNKVAAAIANQCIVKNDPH